MKKILLAAFVFASAIIFLLPQKADKMGIAINEETWYESMIWESAIIKISVSDLRDVNGDPVGMNILRSPKIYFSNDYGVIESLDSSTSNIYINEKPF